MIGLWVKVLITKRQSSLMGENKFVIAILAGVSSNDALSSLARTKRLLRRLYTVRIFVL
jgi:hypothetical protein